MLYTGIFCENEFHWQSKYRSITFNQFGKQFPLGGMNEKGLVIEELNSSYVKLDVDTTKYSVNEFQLTQYILDNCQTIAEVIHELKKFQYQPLFQHLHYLVADKLGNTLIVEFNGHTFDFFSPNENGIPVLSNNNYKESLRYLQNFEGFGGKMAVKNRPGSNERFVTIANMLLSFNTQPPINYAFQILDTVKQTDTQWSLVYDIKNLKVHFRSANCDFIKVFDFKELKKKKSVYKLGGNLMNCHLVGIEELYEVTTEENTKLLQKVILRYSELTGNAPNYNLLYKMTMKGNANLKRDIPVKLVEELDQQIQELPTSSPLLFQDELFASLADWDTYSMVGLGEGTHGTKEFCELKTRVFRYLVENHNYKILAYEYSFKKSLKINDYILSGIGDIDSILSGESWIQNNKEVKNLINWMRDFNQNKPIKDKIQFIGIDNQLDALYPMDVINHIQKNYTRFTTQIKNLVSQISGLEKGDYKNMQQEEYKYRDRLYKSLKTSFEDYIFLHCSDPPKCHPEITVQLIRSLLDSHEFLYRLYKGENIRDFQLAKNALAVCNNLTEDKKVVVWAHNAHIANNPDFYGIDKPAMGYYLKNSIDDKYCTVATTFLKGEFVAVMLDSLGNDTEPITCQILSESPYASTNYVFSQANSENFVLQIKQIVPGTLLYQHLNVKRPLLGVGDLYLGEPEKHYTNNRILNIFDSYDLIFCIAKTNPVTICNNE
jgi:erythromycin esterase-like protein